MQIDELEKRLSKFALREPSNQFLNKGVEILRRANSENWRHRWRPGWVVALSVSLVINVLQYRQAGQGSVYTPAVRAIVADSSKRSHYSITYGAELPVSKYRNSIQLWEHES